MAHTLLNQRKPNGKIVVGNQYLSTDELFFKFLMVNGEFLILTANCITRTNNVLILSTNFITRTNNVRDFFLENHRNETQLTILPCGTIIGTTKSQVKISFLFSLPIYVIFCCLLYNYSVSFTAFPSWISF